MAVKHSSRDIQRVSVSSRREVAARLRTLLGLGSDRDIQVAADELGVDEATLRASIDPDSPLPTVEVVAAVAEYYGVDPSYLLTGEYDPDTHRRALRSRAGLTDAIRDAGGVRSSAPIAQPTPETRSHGS